MKYRTFSLVSLFILFNISGFSQKNSIKSKSEVKGGFSVFTTWWTFTNFGKPEINTQHYEIQARYHLSEKDALGIKVTTWKLFAPMGIPLWDDQLLNEDSFYPGRLRETGVGFTYQRKLWKGLFATLEVLPLVTTYLDEVNQARMGRGFKLYNSYHVGYHIPLFKKGKLFIEPQLHVNHWPINTNVPEEFRIEESKWNNYFLVEPNLYLGIRF